MHSPRVLSRLSLALGAVLLAALAGCDLGGAVAAGIESRMSDALHFLRPAVTAPQLSSTVVSFYAKRGADREAAIYYQARPGSVDSSALVRFLVPSASLDKRPDGTPFLPGDSVLITIRVIDPSRLLLDFQPSGLRFADVAPAKLKIDFSEASRDLDGDGDVDAEDAAHEQQLSIWRQESAGLPWYRLASSLDAGLEEIKADVLGFTGYAIAY